MRTTKLTHFVRSRGPYLFAAGVVTFTIAVVLVGGSSGRRSVESAEDGTGFRQSHLRTGGN